MKVHEFSNGFSSWEQQQESPSSLSCKRFRPLAPKLSGSPSSPPSSSSGVTSATFDLKSFIKPDQAAPTKSHYSLEHKRDFSQVEMHPGGTRWNPTQEQIRILEVLYKGGMRTPNAEQIEHREPMVMKELLEENEYKRTCRSWGFENLKIESRRNINSSINATIATTFNIDNVTLELFPLHPEGR
ncbi:hypothetical protein F2Q68_00015329 [Brassica cretica]|uniref:Uncharacterized protein n=1 Tax=Brassica cretica TaxID=69181 RepID=A0A8S9HH68_BRACR|nr:hypothetical protein F2Q68_00015329 [Brassica cretica]